MRKRTVAGLAFVAMSLMFLGSCVLGAPPKYGRIIIDTYLPNHLMSFSPNTVLDLFGPSGATALMATNTGGNLDHAYGDGKYARLDYQGGMQPGTYYIRVKGNAPADDGAYAIRILTSLPVPEYSIADEFGVVNNPDSYEPDDTVSAGIPTNPVAITLGDRLNRFLTTGGGDADWFVLTLP